MAYKYQNQTPRSGARPINSSNIRITPAKPEKHYVAFATVHIPKDKRTGDNQWSAVPYSSVNDEFIPDNSGAVYGHSRSEAVEKMLSKHYSFPDNAPNLQRLPCIDWME